MRRYILILIFIISVVLSYLIWDNSPEYLKQGGPLLVIGLTCLFMVLTFATERAVVIWRAGGRKNVTIFVRNLKHSITTGDLDQALEACRKQGGCLGNVVGAGLERYKSLHHREREEREIIDETRRAIQEANALETPILERNLSALSTIASVATMIGLLGTTIGMIRSFRAMSHAGAPDASALAVGISEALVNTALGLVTAIIGIILYNYFTARVDYVNSSMEETSFEVLELLRHQRSGS